MPSKWTLRQYIPQLVSLREVGHFVAMSAILLALTMTLCGAYQPDDDDLVFSGRAALAFSLSSMALVTLLDGFIWLLRRLTQTSGRT